MREITTHKVNGLNEAIKIEALDEPGSGGACHHYRMTHAGPKGPINPNGDPSYSEVYFQNGPIGEVGVNGISNEALLAIVADRLEGFQDGPFANPHNEAALLNVHRAIDHLLQRTRERVERGVEGTLVA